MWHKVGEKFSQIKYNYLKILLEYFYFVVRS